MKTKSQKKPVQYFTDEMHKEIFPFQPPISQRGYGGKAVTNPIIIKTGKK